jgi:hypothetical protein
MSTSYSDYQVAFVLGQEGAAHLFLPAFNSSFSSSADQLSVRILKSADVWQAVGVHALQTVFCCAPTLLLGCCRWRGGFSWCRWVVYTPREIDRKRERERERERER